MLTAGLTVHSNAVQPVEAERQTLLKCHMSLRAVPGMPIAHTHAERVAITAHSNPPEHLLESITPGLVMPIGRARLDRPLVQAGFLFIVPYTK